MDALYNWDFAVFRNVFPKDGSEKVYHTEKEVEELPEWAVGLAERKVRLLSPEEVRALPPQRGASVRSPRPTREVRDQLLPRGQEWVKRVYADLDRRFPHEGDEGPGFYVYSCPKRGLLALYDPGVDMGREWGRAFGVTAPKFTDMRRRPADYRPWLSYGSGSPDVFFDFQRDDAHATDTLGAPFYGDTSAQTTINWAYSCMTQKDLNVMTKRLFPLLGAAERAWRLRVLP